MPVLMIQGTSSSVGKTLLCAGLCRIFARKGYSVAPFKPVSDAPFRAAVEGGVCFASVQLLAQAAKTAPDTRMNPVYAHPMEGGYFELHVDGRPVGSVSSHEKLRMAVDAQQEAVYAAYRSLRAQYDIVIIEGSGNPSTLDAQGDLPNMGTARLADAPVLLAGDIDRGGVFAALAGTLSLLEAADRARVKGMIVNKFRGDVALLQSGLDMIRDSTGVQVLGVVPYCRLALEEEDLLGDGDPARTYDEPTHEREIERYADVLVNSLQMDAVCAMMGL